MESKNTLDLVELAKKLGRLLTEQGVMLATAESCTGGWISQCVTDVPGSSAWFDRGFVTYSNAAKADMLGVSLELIAEFGAVSEPVVRAMVTGALQFSQAGVALAVSGIAGPSGGSPDKPVGTVWVGWQRRGCDTSVQCMVFSGDRRAVRHQAVAAALRGVMTLYGE